MKKIILLIFLLVIASTFNCITMTISQTPANLSIPENKDNKQFIPEKELSKERSLSQDVVVEKKSEEEFFNEISKQDPNFHHNLCKDCNPDNKPPGYVDNESSTHSQITSSTTTDAIVIVNPSHPTNQVSETTTNNVIDTKNHELVGIASWYGKEFNGRKTASGEIFNSRGLTAAHRTLPMGTQIRVKNLDNGKEVVLKVNDRGPFVKNRVLDVSEYAAELLDFKNKGLAKVEIKILQEGEEKEVGEGVTAFFYLPAQSQVDNQGTSFYERTLNSKKDKILKEVIDIHNFKFYSIQIGSFRDITNVVKLKEEIESKIKYPVFIVKNSSDYIIRVGNFQTRSEAETLKEKLEEEGYRGFIASPS